MGCLPACLTEDFRMFQNLSMRATKVVIETVKEAQLRGADSIHLDDLVAELITEDQDPDSLDLNEQDPHVKRFMEHEPKPLGVLFSRTHALPHDPFFLPEVAADLIAKLKLILPRSTPRTGGLPASPEFERAFDVAEQLRNEFRQGKVQPLHILAAVLREPGEATRLLIDAGITEEKVLRTIRTGGDLENGNPSGTQ
jgi:Clp amino terminal domain, pathogenicity island component